MPKNGQFSVYSSKIHYVIRQTLNLWKKFSTLTFVEISDGVDEADIRISFEPRNHSKVESYAFGEMTLAHAFGPGNKIGGDIHFRDDLPWDFDVLFDEAPRHGGVSFFGVALHELG